MEIMKKLGDLKLSIRKETAYGEQATRKASNVIDEIMRVLNKGFNKVTGNAPTDITKHFSSNIMKNLDSGVSGKWSINNKIDSIKNDLVVNRMIGNDVTNWAITKLNIIKRL